MRYAIMIPATVIKAIGLAILVLGLVAMWLGATLVEKITTAEKWLLERA